MNYGSAATCKQEFQIRMGWCFASCKLLNCQWSGTGPESSRVLFDHEDHMTEATAKMKVALRGHPDRIRRKIQLFGKERYASARSLYSPGIPVIFVSGQLC